MNPILTELESILLAESAPLFRRFWDKIAFPEIQKLEGLIPSAQLELVAQAVSTALNNLVDGTTTAAIVANPAGAPPAPTP